MDKKGFTLIELLVVISIIGLLSSVVLASLNTARAKARDAARLATLKQVQNALELYKTNNGTYPKLLDNGSNTLQSSNYGRSNSCQTLTGAMPSCVNNYCSDGYGNWDQTMSDLVAQGLLPSIPRDPSNTGYATNNSLCFKYFTSSADNVWTKCGNGLADSSINTTPYEYVLLFSTETTNLNLPNLYWNRGASRPYKYCLFGPLK